VGTESRVASTELRVPSTEYRVSCSAAGGNLGRALPGGARFARLDGPFDSAQGRLRRPSSLLQRFVVRFLSAMVQSISLWWLGGEDSVLMIGVEMAVSIEAAGVGSFRDRDGGMASGLLILLATGCAVRETDLGAAGERGKRGRERSPQRSELLDQNY